MARTINEQEYAEKQKEILAVAQRLVLTRGYERMTIADILAELKISSGAFYHYFPSKPAVLEGLIDSMMQQAEESLVALVRDSDLTALEKLQRFFGWIERVRSTYQVNVIELMRTWYTDENAIVRQKVDEATLLRRAPLLTEIVRQGVQEDVFATAFPDQAGEIVLSIWQAMGNTHARLMLSAISGEEDVDQREIIERIVTTQTAYMDAIEHVLGVPAGSLKRADTQTAQAWIVAMRKGMENNE